MTAPRPESPTPAPRRAKLLAAALAVPLLGVAGVGCDGPSTADRQTSRDVDAAAALVSAGELDQADALLGEAAAREAGPASQANAYALLGYTKQLRGRAKIAEAAAAQAEADRVAFEVVALADAVEDGSALVQELTARDPQPVLASIDEITDGLSGNDGQATFQMAGVEMPTLASLRERLSEVEGQVADLEARRDDAQARSQEQGTRAADAFDRANRVGVSEGMSDFNAYVEAQKQATLAGATARGLELELLPLRQEIELIETRIAQLGQTQQALAELRTNTTDTWGRIQQQLDAQRAELQELITGQPAAGEEGVATMAQASVGERASLMRELLAAAQTAATEAEALLEESAEQYQRAGSSAGQIGPGSGSGPSLGDAISKQAIDLQRSSALFDRGALQAILSNGKALQLEAAEAVATAAGDVQGFAAPEGLAVEVIRGELDATIQEARQSLEEAAEASTAARSGRGGPADAARENTKAATVLTAVSNYALAQISQLGGSLNLIENGQSQADGYLAAAREAVADLDNPAGLGLPAALIDGESGNDAEPADDAAEDATEDADADAPAEIENAEDMDADEPAEDDAAGETDDGSDDQTGRGG